MRTIYVDSDFKCHVTNDGAMVAVETDYFGDKCDAYIEGYCYDIEQGAIYPWVSSDELDGIQQDYERELVAMYEESLTVVGVEL